MQRTHRAIVIGGMFSCAGVWLLSALSGFAFSDRFVNCALLLLAWYGAVRFLGEGDKRLKRCFGWLGALFMLALGLGLRLEAVGETGLWGLLGCLGLAVALAPAAGFATICLYRLLLFPKRRMALAPKRAFWLAFGLMLLCWLPVIVAYFPGITGYDLDFQMYQLRTGSYSSHHPLLHTLFIGLFWRLGGLMGSPSLGYGLHTVAQAILLAAAIAYALSWLCRLRCPRIGWIALLLFFCLSPQHAIMSVSGTKDVLFAAAMLVAVVEICRFCTEPERAACRGVLIADVLAIAVACMLRNNAIYGLLAVMLGAFLFFRRALGKRVLAVLLLGVVLAQCGLWGLSALTGAKDPSVREMLSVPCQQLARVYAKYGLDVPVGYEIREVLPDVEHYAPDRADFTKRSAVVTTTPRLLRFFKLWAREALHYPIEYIDAFLLNTQGFWYVDDGSFAVTYDHQDYADPPPVGCLVLRHEPDTELDAPTALPALRDCFRELFTLNGYRHFAVLWTLLHPALYTWMLGFVLVIGIYKRDRAALLGGCMLLSYLLTLLLGPCAIIRYQYDLMLAAPVLMCFLATRSHEPPAETA